MNRTSIPLVAALAALTATSAFTADGDAAPASDKARIDALEQQLQELKLETQRLAAAQADASKGGAASVGDGSMSIKLGGYAQIASKFYLTDEDRPAPNTIYVNRARIIIDGVLGEHVAFRILPDFATGQTLMQDAYAQLRLVPEAVVQVGKYKVPIGLERLQSDATILFIERSLATDLTPNRDEGVQLGGVLSAGKVEYAIGIFNGAADSGSRDGDVNDSKQGAARVFAQPFRGDGDKWLSGLGVGVGSTFGPETGTVAAPNLPTYKTTGQSLPVTGAPAAFFSYRNGGTLATTTVANGWQWRVDPQAYWYAGPYHVQGEYIVSAQQVSIGTSKAELLNKAWDVEAGWVVTGDDASFNGVKPVHPFSLKSGGWGAVEIGARITRLSIDKDAFPVYADASKAAHSATSYGAALNWYLTKNLKLQTDYELTTFDGGAGAVGAIRDLQHENVISSQLQVSF